MDIQLTLQDLLILTICMLAIVIAIFLIRLLLNVIKITKTAANIMDKGKEDIQKSIQAMPNILSNVEQISGNIKDTTNVVAGIKENPPGVSKYIQVAAELIGSVIHSFTGK